MSENKDMPAALTTTDFLIAAEACLGQAKHHRRNGEYREALRYGVTGLKLFAHVPDYNITAEESCLELYDLIEGCSARRKLPAEVNEEEA